MTSITSCECYVLELLVYFSCANHLKLMPTFIIDASTYNMCIYFLVYYKVQIVITMQWVKLDNALFGLWTIVGLDLQVEAIIVVGSLYTFFVLNVTICAKLIKRKYPINFVWTSYLFHYMYPKSLQYNSNYVYILHAILHHQWKVMNLQWGAFSTILPNYTILNYIWPQVHEIPSWEDRVLLFLTLRLTKKTWKKLVVRSEPIAI
jgi:hypothetical protein